MNRTASKQSIVSMIRAPRGNEQPVSEAPVRGSQRRANARHDSLRLTPHGLRPKSQDAISRAPQHGIPPRISAQALSVIGAIHFNDETHCRRIEVSDETTKEWDLSTKHHAKLTRRFRLQRRCSEGVSAERGARAPGAALLGLHFDYGTRACCRFESCLYWRRRRASAPPCHVAERGAGAMRAPSRMTRSDNKPEPSKSQRADVLGV